jgi:CheY-like chemotaxis protein
MGAMASQTAPVAWNAFMRRTFAMFDGLAKRKQLQFHLEINPTIETHCLIDLKKTERILSNLISNAIKFTQEGGWVSVHSEVQSNHIFVKVSDTGPGISAEEKEFIFERYRQGQAALGAAQPGYGIGLALCKEYANLIGAELWVESEPGKGASFYLRIPVASLTNGHSVNDIRQDTAEKAFEQALESAAKGHILIAEDHPDLRDFLVDILREDYRISAVANGQEAWNILEKDPSVNLVISDVMMPAVNGFDLLQKTRAHPRLGFLPFIMVTALNSDQDKLQALRLGVDGFITKPFAIAELKTLVANRMKQQLKRSTFSGAESLETTSHNTPESYDEVWLSELEAHIRGNLHRPEFKVPELAYLMHITERTLYNRVKAYTGLTPSEYLRKARLDLAMRYALARKYKTLKELAHAVGMTDPRNFANTFKKEFGRAPMEVKDEDYQQGKA